MPPTATRAALQQFKRAEQHSIREQHGRTTRGRPTRRVRFDFVTTCSTAMQVDTVNVICLCGLLLCPLVLLPMRPRYLRMEAEIARESHGAIHY